MMRTFLVLVKFLILGLNLGDGARILAIFPVPFISHQVVFRAMMLALNKRGHELVVVTPMPVNDPTLINYTEVDISGFHNTSSTANFYDVRKFIGWDVYMGRFLRKESLLQTERIFQNAEFRLIYSRESYEKFDLLIVGMNMHHAFCALAARFNVPIIGVVSMGLNQHTNYKVGNPILASHLSSWDLGKYTGNRLTFWERLVAFVEAWRHFVFHEFVYIPKQNEIARKYLGSDIPYVGDIVKNVSLIFINQRAPLTHIRPNVPKVIPFGGFHMTMGIQQLPKDIKEFLDGATEGFIYMSLGSNVKSNMLPNSVLAAFIAVFSKLRQRILWKFEDEFMPGKPKNVYISKWLPQQAVLGHHNIKTFIYQGGIQSTEEAVKYAVPLIGIPIMSDQDSQIEKMVSLGVARSLEIVDLSSKDLEEALNDVINNKRYKKNMVKLRSLYNDIPYDPLENAVWWTEFVIRHKGAPHLHSSTADEPWYQRNDVDIVAFISITTLTMVIISLVTTYSIIIYTFRSLGSCKTVRKEKSS